MSLEKILTAIEEKARSEAESILGTAHEEADRILTTARDQSATEAEHFQQELRAEREREWSHKLSRAHLDSRKKILQATTSILEDVFTQAIHHIRTLDTEAYQQWISDKIFQISKEGLQTIIFSKDDANRLPEFWITHLRERLASLGVNGEVNVDFSGKGFSGGFILKYPDYEMIVTCEEMVKRVRESMEAELTTMLFNGE